MIQEETNTLFNLGNACYHSVQRLLSSRLLSKNVNIRKCKTIILPVSLYGCETWSPILRAQHRVRAFDNRVLWRIFGPKREEVKGDRGKVHMRSFITCTLRQV
jgi:hypothetical protein